jgi:hypothetical protein
LTKIKSTNNIRRTFKKTMTEKALEANRRNALKSTGPKNRQLRTYFPNTKHGILASIPVLPEIEDPKEWDDFVDGLKRDLHPDGTLENTLVERIAGLLWRMRRLQMYEHKIVEKELSNVPQEVASKWRPKKTNNAQDMVDNLFESGYEPCNYNQVEHEALIYPKVLFVLDRLYVGTCSERINKDVAREIAKISAQMYIDDLNKKELTKPKEEQIFKELNQKYLKNDFSNRDFLEKILKKDAKACGFKYKSYISNIYSKADQYCKFITQDLKKMKEAINVKRHEVLLNAVNRQSNSETSMRFETHLHRQYIQTLHELQRLQGMRIGITGPSDAVDTTGVEK